MQIKYIEYETVNFIRCLQGNCERFDLDQSNNCTKNKDVDIQCKDFIDKEKKK
jgi:hypothetical protein